MNLDDDSDLLEAYLEGMLSPEMREGVCLRLQQEPELAEQLMVLATDQAQMHVWASSQGSGDDAETGTPLPVPLPWKPILTGIAAAIIIGLGLWVLNPRQDPLAHIVKMVNGSLEHRSTDQLIIREDEVLSLPSGFVEIKTRTGVRLVLEGPFKGRFSKVTELVMDVGKVYAEVPEGSEGFAVRTPAGRIVDLGTRFGVEVSQDAKTEVQVYEGRVVARLGDRESTQLELQHGQAAQLDQAANEIRTSPFSETKFTRVLSEFYESFSLWGKDRRLAGHRGWIDSKLVESKFEIQKRPQGLAYPGLARSEGDSLDINTHMHATSPVGRPWPYPYLSGIIQFDDDFTKKLRFDAGIEHGILLSLGSADPSGPARLRLVLRAEPGTHGRQLRLGLVSESGAAYSPDTYHLTQVFFVALQLGETEGRLWINSAPEAFGTTPAPPPDLVIPLSEGPPARNLWIGHAENPVYAWWFLDELRGGYTWSEITPRFEAEEAP